MRNEHLESHRQEDCPNALTTRLNPDLDEVQPLLFDLVRSDDVETVKRLLPHLQGLGYIIQRELGTLAAYSGSAAMLDLMCQGRNLIFTSERLLELVTASIDAQNMETLKWLLSGDTGKGARYRSVGDYQQYSKILSHSIITGSVDVLEQIEPYFIRMCEATHGGSAPAASILLAKGVVKATERSPAREKFLLGLWDTVLNKATPWSTRSIKLYLGDALGYVAETTCSVSLARALLQHGANIDARRSDASCTPLHRAVRQNSTKAAEFTRFLLHQGANPKSIHTFGGVARSVGDEVGAREIAKWLGISWDELVRKASNDREKGIVWSE